MNPTWTSDCGTVKLWQADCLDVLPTLQGVDAVVTDPPYGVESSQNGMRRQLGHKISTNYAGVFADTPEYIAATCVTAIELCIKKAAAVAVSPGFKCLNLYPRPSHIGGFYYQGQSTVTAWGAAWWQPVLFYGKDPKTGHLQRDMFIGKSNGSQCDIDHPCPKEIGSWSLLVERMSHEGQTVLDPFMGSGTTGVACVRAGRSFLGIERDQKYFEIAKRRISDELIKKTGNYAANPDKYPLLAGAAT